MNLISSSSQSIMKELQRGLQDIAPIVVQEILAKGWQDTRIAKLVSGIFLTLAGLYFISKSGFTKNVNHKISQVISPNREQARTEQKIQWSVVSLGFLVTAYGIYNLVSSLVEFKPIASISKFNPENQCENIPNFDIPKEEDAIYEAKKRIDLCPYSKKLWHTVERGGAVTIFQANPAEAHFGAFCDPERREIHLAHQNIKLMTKDLLFELNNLKQSFSLEFLDSNTCFLTAEQYALKKEKIEYDSALQTYKITQKCIDLGAWPANSFLYNGFKSGLWTNFDQYLETQKNSGHFNTYIEDWHHTCSRG